MISKKNFMHGVRRVADGVKYAAIMTVKEAKEVQKSS